MESTDAPATKEEAKVERDTALEGLVDAKRTVHHQEASPDAAAAAGCRKDIEAEAASAAASAAGEAEALMKATSTHISTKREAPQNPAPSDSDPVAVADYMYQQCRPTLYAAVKVDLDLPVPTCS